MKPVPLFRTTTGLNMVTDPAELTHDMKKGQVELSLAINADVTDTGTRISRRKGRAHLTAGNFSSGFAGPNDVLCVREDADCARLFRVDPYRGDLVGIRSGLTLNKPMAFCAVNQRIYYSNGVQTGIYQDGVSQDWVRSDETYDDWETDLDFADAPPATSIAVLGGYMLLAEHEIVWISREFDYSAYNLANRYYDWVDEVMMIQPVEDGVWIGTTREMLFLSGTDPSRWAVAARRPGGVLRNAVTAKSLTAQDLGIKELQGAGFAWTSSKGIIWGGPSGQFVNLTDKKIVDGWLAGLSGFCQVVGSRIIASVNP
jgi:hypothetical protein